MKKNQRILLSIGAMLGGWLLCGFGLTTSLGNPGSTIAIVFGIAFAVGGFIFLILALKKPE